MLRDKITLIAEIGQNHCGNMSLAKWLIDLAKVNGADLAKFQLYDSEVLYGEKQESELSFDQAKMLFEYGKKAGIEVFFSVFDKKRIVWCEDLGVKTIKIAASQSDNLTLIESAATVGNVIISRYKMPYKLPDWIKSFHKEGNRRHYWLFCVPHYPTELSELRFNLVPFNDTWDCGYQGYSDHTIGLNPAKIALARGAKIIEKHFAIDHETGVDVMWSMTPPELSELRKFADAVGEAL